MARQVLNQSFPSRLTRNSYATISVVDPEGRPKILTVKPGGDKPNWLRCEWAKDHGGRAVELVSVDLTTEREQAGCVFLRDAYIDEGWAAGWVLWESYVDEQYFRKVANDDGKVLKIRRERPADRGHFPPNLLPKKVQAMATNAVVTRRGPRWEAPNGAEHPADVKKAADRKAIDVDKVRLQAEIAKATA